MQDAEDDKEAETYHVISCGSSHDDGSLARISDNSIDHRG